MSHPAPRVLLISSDTIDSKMAGSGIRYWNLAHILSSHQPITLATPNRPAIAPQVGVEIVPYEAADEAERGRLQSDLIEAHDVIVAQHLPYLYTDPELLASKFLVIDLYAPWILEKLEYARIDPARGEPNRADDVEILNRLLTLGDFFICASERQRDFWIGALAAADRLDLDYLQGGANLRRLIDIVPFGLPEHRPLPSEAGPRERFPQLNPETAILLWNGGLWNWLDPLTAIRAIGLLATDGFDVALVFMGVRSPGAQVAEMSIVDQARSLADELGLLNARVLFNEWVEYENRQTWLLASAATLSLHETTLESRYAFRTRLLDNLWCQTPIIATEGDVLADIVSSEDIGVVVPPGDAVAVAEAVKSTLQKDRARHFRSRLATVAQTYTWEQVAAPLVNYCQEPWKHGDRDGDLETQKYVSKLERLYTETTAYAKELERTIAAKNAALEAQQQSPNRKQPFIQKLRDWRNRAIDS